MRRIFGAPLSYQGSLAIRTFFTGVVFVFMVVVMSLPLSTAVADPLHDAIEAGDWEKVKELVCGGADVNAKDNDGKSLLHDAAHLGHQAIAKLLIAHGADVNVKDKDGQTPLDLARENGPDSMVRIFEDAMASSP